MEVISGKNLAPRRQAAKSTSSSTALSCGWRGSRFLSILTRVNREIRGTRERSRFPLFLRVLVVQSSSAALVRRGRKRINNQETKTRRGDWQGGFSLCVWSGTSPRIASIPLVSSCLGCSSPPLRFVRRGPRAKAPRPKHGWAAKNQQREGAGTAGLREWTRIARIAANLMNPGRNMKGNGPS